MGKGKRIKAARRALPRRRIVVVDALEVGQHSGTMTLRAGRTDAPPLLVTIPAGMAADVVDNLRTAALDAEEDYWDVIVPLARRVGSGDPHVVSSAVEAWLLAQPWEKVVREVPAGDPGDAVLVSYAGHVGLAVEPPLAAQPSLAVFDPQQLHRLSSSFDGAAAEARRVAGLAPVPLLERLAAAHEFLAAQPWPAVGHVDPTPEDAEAEMKQRRADFLARSPFIRPDENTLVLPED